MEIYFAKNGRKEGPFAIDEVRRHLGQGLCSPDDLVWHAGLTEWTPISAIGELKMPGTLPPHRGPGRRMPPPREYVGKKEEPSLLAAFFFKMGEKGSASDRPFSEADYQAFVGPRSEYYLSHWSRISFAINWTAFFFSLLWLVYRKMYRISLIFTGLLMAFGIFESLCPLPEAWMGPLRMVVALSVGLAGNELYKRHVHRALALIKAQKLSPELEAYEMRRQGGTNLAASVGLLLILASIAIWAAFYAAPGNTALQAQVARSIQQKLDAIPTTSPIRVERVELTVHVGNAYEGSLYSISNGKERKSHLKVTTDGGKLQWRISN